MCYNALSPFLLCTMFYFKYVLFAWYFYVTHHVCLSLSHDKKQARSQFSWYWKVICYISPPPPLRLLFCHFFRNTRIFFRPFSRLFTFLASVSLKSYANCFVFFAQSWINFTPNLPPCVLILPLFINVLEYPSPVYYACMVGKFSVFLLSTVLKWYTI